VVVVSGTEIVCRTLPHAAGAGTVTVSVTDPIPKVGNLANGYTYTSVAANPAPVAQEFPVPTANGGPVGIAAGPGGDLWFGEYDGNQIGRVTPTGAITEYPVPTAGNRPYGIAAGPDGDMWFAEATGKIGRVTPAGVFTEFFAGIGTNSHPDGIAAGPDGNMWFTEYGNNKIGVLVIAPPAITALSPFSGPTNATTNVTITGSGFVPGATVSFGGTPAPVLVNNPTSITTTAPARSPGTVDVVVTTGGATATVHGFTYGAPDPAPPPRLPGAAGNYPDPLPPPARRADGRHTGRRPAAAPIVPIAGRN
jgi:streptogramin lyase